MKTSVLQSRWVADGALLLIAAVWGGTFFLVKDATSTFPVLAFLAVRFSLACAALIPIALTVRRWPTRQELRLGVIAGVAFWFGYIFQTFSLKMIDSGRTGFITGLYVILVPLLALVLLGHRLTWRVLIGAGLAVIGMGLLSNAPGGNLLGDLLAFLCAVSFALQIVVVEKFPRSADWRIMALIQSSCVALLSVLLVPLQGALYTCQSCSALRPFADPFPTSLPLNVFIVAGFTGLIATAAGLAIQVWAQRRLPPSDAALIFAMESPFSAVFGAVFRGETLSLSGIVGCGLILAGMVTTSLADETAQKNLLRLTTQTMRVVTGNFGKDNPLP